jgi:hypothetical protein
MMVALGPATRWLQANVTHSATMLPYIFASILGAACLLLGVFSAAAVNVRRYQTHELIFTAGASPANPFDTYLLKLEVTDPAGRRFNVDGYYDGDGSGGQDGRVWKARITPYATGVWSWRTIAADAYDERLAHLTGEFRCVESEDFGGLVGENHHFRLQQGPYVYLQGNFLDLAAPSTHVYMSEKVSDASREFIIARNRNVHGANKINVYLANRGDYQGLSVTPWLGSAAGNDKARMDLARWKLYDRYIRHFKNAGLFAELWFFADDSKFGELSDVVKERFFRYAMARTSAFSHTLYVIALEWEEGWSKAAVMRSGDFIWRHNPWQRPLSVHSRGVSWGFPSAKWAGFIASQAGNKATPERVNRSAVILRTTQKLPHIGEEFGYLHGRSDARLRANLWANFLGGAAGGGTGSDLKAFQRFLSQSRVPFQRMMPSNHLVREGGSRRFLLAEPDHHYVLYSLGGTIRTHLTGVGLAARWFNPRDANAVLGEPFSVSPGIRTFTPPDSTDAAWVLWVSDGTNLNTATLGGFAELTVSQEIVTPKSRAR